MSGELASPAGSERAAGRIDSMMRRIRRPASIRMLGFLVAADFAVLTTAAWAVDARENDSAAAAACAEAPCVTTGSTLAFLFNGGPIERRTALPEIETGTSTTAQRRTTTTSTSTTTTLPPTTTTTVPPETTTTTLAPTTTTTIAAPELMSCEEITGEFTFAGNWQPRCMDGEPPVGECDTATPVDACAYPDEDVIRFWFDDPRDRAKGRIVHAYWRFVVAHENAHAIQDEEGILSSNLYSADQLELQADSYARALGYIPPVSFRDDDPSRVYSATDQSAAETCRLFEARGNDYC